MNNVFDQPPRNWIGIFDPAVRQDGVPLPSNGPTQERQGRLGRVPLARAESGGQPTFSSSSYGTYHLDSRVLPCRFCKQRRRG